MPKDDEPHPHRDPSCVYTFRVKWDGRVIAGIRQVSALKRTTEVMEYREGGDAGTTRKLPGRTKYEAITFERGVTHDTTFESWADQVEGTATSGTAVRKEVRIEVYDAEGQLTHAYNVHRCWPSSYAALTGLEEGDRHCLIESLTLENEGWERDVSVKKRPHKPRPKR